MANEEQLAILRQGVEVWNEWREENPDVGIDLMQAKLRGADLRWANLAEVNLAVADLTNADLERANLRGANLFGADLINTDLLAANLTEANIRSAISGAILEAAVLIRADLEGASVVRSWLEGADLREANLRYANLTESNLRAANLSKADLTNAILRDTKLIFADLRETVLERADLERANLMEANLEGANLKGANLGWANLMEASLKKANLCGANLREAVLTRADLDGADLTASRMRGTTLGDNELAGVLGLGTIEHYGPSTIGMDTLYRSRGKIPIEFLRGCGLSELDIEYGRLANPAISDKEITDIIHEILNLSRGAVSVLYNSIFISYSSKDQEFAQKLYDSLQNNGVRCWFAPEDMKIGDQIRPRIDQEIRLRDKLLVILSENSVKSEWVGDEVEAALEEESKSNRLVLFPIRLDDTVMNTRDDWAAKIKRRRHIGDFSNWKDKASYQKGFERLLRDLKATGGQVNGE